MFLAAHSYLDPKAAGKINLLSSRMTVQYRNK